MSRKYKIGDGSKVYFVTFTVIHWIAIFIRDEYRKVFLESIAYCQKEKGLEVYAWCMMTSHIHLLIGSNKEPLEGIIRDLKCRGAQLCASTHRVKFVCCWNIKKA
jgi:REP element-mobilizing transposase RayT